MTRAFRFVLLMSIVSLFADMTYEGGRSIAGPFLAHLGATGLVVGLVAGFGELAGFALRYASGTVVDRTRKYWATAFLGYAINLLTVPALALARAWPMAAGLIVGERFGRGVRKPATGAMMSHAGSQLGQGWVFGFNQAMDQTGATLGPLLVAAILTLHGGFSHAFGSLAIPALLALAVLTVAQRQFPVPRDLERHAAESAGFPPSRAFWIYAAAGGCLAAGFADFALISYHFSKTHLVSNGLIPVLYAAAMLVGAATAPFLGRAFDRYGTALLAAVFAVSAAFAPLAFLGTLPLAIVGMMLWGLGMGAQDALLPALVVQLAPADRRATALGRFDAVYGVAWFLGSAAMGALYDRSILALVVFSLVLQIGCALPLLFIGGRLHHAAKGTA